MDARRVPIVASARFFMVVFGTPTRLSPRSEWMDCVRRGCSMAQNSQAFTVYIKEVLAPELRKGDTVICDNLSCHHSLEVHEALEAVGASLMFLPTYSPDLNPIEMAFSKLKALLRKQIVREFNVLIERLAEILPKFTPAECRNLIRHVNYATN
jgi:transposase